MNESDELSRELHTRSHDVDGHPIGLDRVKRSARRIQMRHRLAGAAVAAAVLSIAVPTALAVNGTMLNGQQNPVDPATQVPSPSPSVTESAAPKPPAGGAELTTAGIPRGDQPSIPYLRGTELLRPDGTTLSLGATYTAITPYADGWLANPVDDPERLVFLDADGDELRSQGGSAFVVNAGGSQVAYATNAETGQYELVLAPTIGAESAKARLVVPIGSTPVGFLAEDAVVYQTHGQNTAVEWTSFDGSAEELPGLLNADGATQTGGGLVSGMTFDDMGPGSCSTVMQVESKERLWEGCDFSLGRFSPDGQYVIGHPAYRDGIGDGEVAILDARNGDVFTHFRSTLQSQAFISTVVWEDDSHLLATVFQDGAWTIVRIGADGSLEAATDPVPGNDLDPAFYLTAQP